ncbi:hypothetical protein KPH14_003014 [Odynerus spinipes]|uniref:Odorant receptor n=1 Tax=Odynerus spinipes TaxID=1348599 RepID=A0AAD9RWM2_9HYME|nr:hypothetical protein KPH14_003014 [Odynerus spinipes]
MDTFEHSYYSLNRRLLLLVGQWPYQNSTDRFCRMVIILTMLLSFFIFQVALLFSNTGFDIVVELVPPLSAVLTITTKFFMLHIYRDNVRNLLERMIDNWKLWKSEEEIDIMHKFGKEGEFLTFLYTIYIYSCMMMFLVLPFVPRILDKISPLNESRHLSPIFRSEYFIDEDEHFLSIYFHMSIVIVIGITVLVTTDVLFLIFNSHICGVLTAVGFRMEHFLNDQTCSRKMCLENVISAIKSHKKAMEFAELIEASYSFPLFIQVGSSLICMSVSLFQILIVLDKPSEMFRYVAFTTGQLVHIFCMCYPGQRMIDYSTEIQFKAYSSLWYDAPVEIQQLILLILRRSLEPCYLTAGKVFVFYLESFSTILQTSTSYFMVFELFTCGGDPDIIMDVGTIMMAVTNFFMKYYTYYANILNMKALLDIMIIDWRTWTSKGEIEILEKYAKEGRFYTLAYTTYIYIVISLFVIISFLSPVLDIIAPLNETRPMELPVIAQYFINQEEHFYPLYLHTTFSIFLGMTTFIAADTQFFVFTCHLCGVFSVVGFRLENLLKDGNTVDSMSSYHQEECFKYVTLSIKGHKRAIEFANLIESSFSYPLLIQCGINIAGLSISLYRITVLLSFSGDTIRYVLFLIGQLFHVFCITYFGQKIIDHSNATFFKAYCGPWYNKPVRIHKLLLLVMKRSLEPMKLTAGKIFVFSLEGFSAIVQTSTSYFMVLLSVR